MKIFKIELLILASLFVIAFVIKSCTDATVTDVNIRIENSSIYNYNNIRVQAGTTDHSYGTVLPGTSSIYQSFDSAYSYAFVELEIEGATYTIQPIDFIGEEQLKPGYYTYIITANSSEERYGKLTIELRED
jgi:hypothetical protein